MPPMSCTSLAVKRPPGRRSAISGVRLDTASTSSISKADAGLVRDRRDVQRGIGRAAGRGDDGAGVFERRARDDVARPRPAARHRRHDDGAGAPGVIGALGIDPRDHRHVRHAEPQRLGDHRHRVGGELSGAGADRRQAGALEPRPRSPRPWRRSSPRRPPRRNRGSSRRGRQSGPATRCRHR